MNEKHVALYVRVSTEMQKEKGESVQFQKSRLIEYAKEQGLSYQIYDDSGHSAKDFNRPALKRLIAEIENKKISIVVVLKIDRITRQMRDLYHLLALFEKHEVGFKSLTQSFDSTTTVGRGMMNLLMSFGQMEREMTSDRVAEHMLERAKCGRWNGGVVPHGYTSYELEVRRLTESGLSREKAETKATEVVSQKKILYVDKEECELIKIIFKQYLKFESLRAVTHWLNTNGYKTRNGATWAASSISRILTNPIYCGLLLYNKRTTSKMTGKLKNNGKEKWITASGEHRGIIDKVIFDKVQAILERQSIEPRRKMSDYLFSGLVRCGSCGASMNGSTQKKRNANRFKTYAYYKCHNVQSKGHSVCKAKAITKEAIETSVIRTINSLSKSKEFRVDAKKVLNEYNRQSEANFTPLKKEKESLFSRLQLLDKKKGNLLNLLAEGTIKKEEYKTATANADKELSTTNERLFEIERKLGESTAKSISFKAVYEIVKSFKSYWKNFDYLSKKDLLWAIISKISVRNRDIQLELFFLPELFSDFANESVSVRVFYGPEKGM